jgi:protein OPY2
VVGIAIIVFLIWKFWLKGRRRAVEEYHWQEEDNPPEKDNVEPGSFMQMRDARSSTHTVASLASTVLTRASNIIQIAYIPGVTNRNANSPGLLVPPVPPIPIPTTPSTVSHFDGEQRFFVPELRDSTYSDTSSIMTDAQRKSIASSLARSSIGTTIYKDDAVAHPMPAATIVRGNAKVVSVKSAGSAAESPADTPQIERGEFSRQVSGVSTTSRPVIVKMLGSSDSLRPSPLGSQKSTVSSITGKSMKPVTLNIMKKGNKGPTSVPTPTLESSAVDDRRSLATIPSRPHTQFSVADSVATDFSIPHSRARASVARSHREEEDDYSSDDDEAHERSRQSLLKGPARRQTKSPFDDDAAIDDKGKGKAQESESERNKSPFEDDNAV